MNRLPPDAERELKEQMAHLRSIQEEGRVMLSCQCPICPGMLQGKDTLVCSKDSRHWLSVKEITSLPVEECVSLLKARALIWTCPYCRTQIIAISDAGKCPSCDRYIEPGLYGKVSELRGRTAREGESK